MPAQSISKPNASWRSPLGGAFGAALLALGTLLALMVLLPGAAHAQEDATTTGTFEVEEEIPQEEEEGEGAAVLEATTSPPETTMPPNGLGPASVTTVPAYENTDGAEETPAPAAEEQYGPPATLADTGGPGLLIGAAALMCGAAILTYGVVRGRPAAAEQPDHDREGGDDDFMPRD